MSKPSPPRCRPDRGEIARACSALFPYCRVVELRAFVRDTYGGIQVISGYFDNHDALVDAAVEQNATGEVYVTLNELKPALLARRANRVQRKPKTATADGDILRRLWLLIDLDPKRPSDVSSTEEEHHAALQKAREIRSFLVDELEWTEPIVGNSGNGVHLLFAIDLQNNDDARNLVQQCLQALSQLFSDDTVSVDESVFNASRISKLFGTVARKGDDLTDRPHRVSRLLHVPGSVEVVDERLLRTLSALANRDAEPMHHRNGHGGVAFDIDAYLHANGVEVRHRKDWNGGTKWVLSRCPWCESEDAAAVVLQFPNGAIAARCHHNRCTGKGWYDFRDAVDPGWKDKKSTSIQRSPHTNATSAVGSGRKPAPPPVPYKKFPVEALPEPARGLVVAGAKAIGCDEAMIALPLLAALASAIGATHRIGLKSVWSEPSVLWCVVVAESGSHKSPAQDQALEPLRRLQAWKFAEYSDLENGFWRDMELYEADRKQWQRTGRKNNEPPPEKPVPPVLPRYIVSDITIEALAEQLSLNPRGLLADCDELGALLKSFDQYRGGRGGDVQRWLSIHRAGELIVDRKTGIRRTMHVPNAAVSIAGGIQPGVLRRALGQEHFENGLAARFLLAAPPSRLKRWNDFGVHESCTGDVRRVFGRLLALQFRHDHDELPAPEILPLSPEAKECWTAFYDAHAIEEAEMVGTLASVWSKLEGYAARFALVHHLVCWSMTDLPNPGPVGADSMQAGVALSQWFANEAIRNHAQLGETDEDRELRLLAGWVERRGGFTTARELQRGPRQYRASGAAEAALNELVRAGYGAWEPLRTTAKGGHPSRTFRLIVEVSGDRTIKNHEKSEELSPSPLSPPDMCALPADAVQEVEWIE